KASRGIHIQLQILQNFRDDNVCKSNECVDRRAKFKVVGWLTLGGGSPGGINKILKTISFGL
ncbi:hypothetical protein FCV25MIE_16130, partial [Fagus crenata]